MKLYDCEKTQQTYLLDENEVDVGYKVYFDNVFYKREEIAEEYKTYIDDEGNDYLSFEEYCDEYVDDNDYLSMGSEYTEYWKLEELEKIANDFPYCSIENEFCDTQDFIDGLEDVLYYRAYDERILELVELSEKPLKFITKKEYSTGVFEVWQDESTLVYYEVDNSFYVGSIRCQTNTLTEEDLREEYNYAV